MTDRKDRKTTIALEPGQVALVLGMESGPISRQLFARPDVDAMLGDDHSDIPFYDVLASAFPAFHRLAYSNRKPPRQERLEEPALS